MERFPRQIRSPTSHKVLRRSFYYKRNALSLQTQIDIILKMFSAVGIDIVHSKKPQKLMMVFQLFYRWLMCLLMLYFFAARVYKAAQPKVPLMLSFSETAATASSIILRFIILGKRQAFAKLLRSLHSIQMDEEVVPSGSYIRREKIFFVFAICGFSLTMFLCTAKAFGELLSPQWFQVYHKSYLFSANFRNDTLLYKATNGMVFASHMLYIFHLYSVPSLCLLICCLACNGIGYFNLTFKTKLKDNPDFLEWKPPFMKTCITHLRRMHALANRAEEAFSTILFFLYNYLLCSLFFIVSLTVSKYSLDIH